MTYLFIFTRISKISESNNQKERKKLTSGFCPDAGMSRYNPFTSVSRISNSADNSERRKMALDFNSCLDLPPALPSK